MSHDRALFDWGCDSLTELNTPDASSAHLQVKRMLRSSQRLRVTGALVEIRSMPVAA